MMSSLFFTVLPYVAFTIFLVGTIYRYKYVSLGYSSLSSQFLEGRKLFWSTIPFHFGLLIVLFGHFIAFLFPKTLLTWNAVPIRLLIIECTGIIFGLLAFVGIIGLITRRLLNERIKIVTSKMDLCLEFLLFFQIFLGLWVAIAYRWGSSWFAADLSPYLWSLITFSPRAETVLAMPHVIQMHILGAFLIILIFPFTRLVHILVAPLHYIFRPYQQVMWNWNPRMVRSEKSEWTYTRPKNT